MDIFRPNSALQRLFPPEVATLYPKGGTLRGPRTSPPILRSLRRCLPMLLSLAAVHGMLAANASADEVQRPRPPGTIHFQDGTTQEFTEFEMFLGVPFKTWSIVVDYRNGKRDIPVSKIQSYEILEWMAGKDCLQNGRASVQTTTGMKVDHRFTSACSVFVVILDELTGEKVRQKYLFQRNGKLNIKKIVFRHAAGGSGGS